MPKYKDVKSLWGHITPERHNDTEPLMTPAVAQHWLVNVQQIATRSEDGKTRLNGDQTGITHIGYAALLIANSDRPRRISEIVDQVVKETDPQKTSPLNPKAFTDLVKTVTENYEATLPNPVFWTQRCRVAAVKMFDLLQ